MFKLILSLFSAAALAGAQGSREISSPNTEFFLSRQNLLENSNFETGSTRLWTASGGALSVNTTAANVGRGTTALSFDASAGSQTVTSTAVTIPAGMFGKVGIASCNVKTAATDYKIDAYDGSSSLGEVTVSSAATYTRYTARFTFPSTGSISLRLVSASDAAIMYVDDCFLGEDQVVQHIGAYGVSSTTTGTFGTSSNSYVDVTNATVTVTTNGSPVYIGVQPDGATPSYIQCQTDLACVYTLLRDATTLGEWQLADQHLMPLGALWYVDAPAAGTYTYKWQAKNTGTGTTYFRFAKIVVRELK